MPLLGDLIRYAIENKRRKKEREEFLKLFEEEKQPFAGKKVSELAAVLGGVGESMPIPEHMGGRGALPFSMNPILSPGQQQQLATPGVIDAKNAKLAKAKALVRSGYEPGEEAGLKMLMPQEQDKGSWQSAGNGFLFNTKTGNYMGIPEYEGPRSPIVLPKGSSLIDPTNGKEIYRSDNPNTIVRDREISVVGRGGRTETQRVYDVIDMDNLKVLNTIEVPGTTWKDPSKGGLNVTLPDGTVISEGGSFPAINPAMQTESFKKYMDAKQNLDAWNDVERLFRPEFLTLLGRSENLFADVLSYAGGAEAMRMVGISPEKHWTREMFYTAVNDASSRYIRSITGAQMSEYEIKRLLGAVPNVKDDPVGFSAKLAYAKHIAEVTMDAYQKALASGLGVKAAQAEADRVHQTLFPEVSSDPYSPEAKKAFAERAETWQLNQGFGF